MNKKILLGVSGSISAYKAADIVSGLRKKDIEVHVVMTKAATGFITSLTLQALSQNYVHTDVLDEPKPSNIVHVNLPQEIDAFCLSPASANVIAKIAHGIADDQLTSMVLAIKSQTPKFIAPAMNTFMYENPVTKRNIQILRDLGWQIIEPKVARLACGETGIGALADVHDIIAKISA